MIIFQMILFTDKKRVRVAQKEVTDLTTSARTVAAVLGQALSSIIWPGGRLCSYHHVFSERLL